MNLPVGEVLEKRLNIKKFDIIKNLDGLMKEQFTGYLIVTIEGYSGIEEGALFVKKGRATGGIFEYGKFNVSVFGDAAMQQFMNACSAEVGVMDINRLTSQQVDLIIAFNEKILLSREMTARDLNKFLPKEYESKFAEKTLESVLKKKESRYDVFKRLGLAGVKGE